MLNRCWLPAITLMAFCLAACDQVSPLVPDISSPTVRAVNVTGNTTLARKGDSSQLHAIAQMSDGTEADVTANARWGSGDSSIATVSPTGLLTAIAPGNSTVSAQSQDARGERSVEVQDPTAMRSLAIQGNPTFSSPGQTQQLQAIGTRNDGSQQNVSAQTTWSSSDPRVASVSDGGLVTAVGPGQADITASMGPYSSKVTSTVPQETTPGLPLPLPSIIQGLTISCANSILIGGTSQCKATAHRSDGTDVDVTKQTNWSSANSLIAPVTSSGLISGLTLGNSEIVGNYEGNTGKTNVNVRPF